MTMTKLQPTVYLAAAIDLVSHEKNPFEILAEKLAPLTCFNPLSAYRNGNNGDSNADNYIAAANLAALENASIMVAWVSPNKFSIGLVTEVLYARLHNIPVLFVMEEPKLGVYGRLLVNRVVKPEELTVELLYEMTQKTGSLPSAYDTNNRNVILQQFRKERR